MDGERERGKRKARERNDVVHGERAVHKPGIEARSILSLSDVGTMPGTGPPCTGRSFTSQSGKQTDALIALPPLTVCCQTCSCSWPRHGTTGTLKTVRSPSG